MKKNLMVMVVGMMFLGASASAAQYRCNFGVEQKNNPSSNYKNTNFEFNTETEKNKFFDLGETQGVLSGGCLLFESNPALLGCGVYTADGSEGSTSIGEVGSAMVGGRVDSKEYGITYVCTLIK